MPHINVELSRDLLERMRRAALERGCTRKRFITDAIENAIVLQLYSPKVSPVAPEYHSSDLPGKGHVDAPPTPRPVETQVPSDPIPEVGAAVVVDQVAVEPPYHADTRMPLSEALKALFPERLQAKIEQIRNS